MRLSSHLQSNSKRIRLEDRPLSSVWLQTARIGYEDAEKTWATIRDLWADDQEI